MRARLQMTQFCVTESTEAPVAASSILLDNVLHKSGPGKLALALCKVFFPLQLCHTPAIFPPLCYQQSTARQREIHRNAEQSGALKEEIFLIFSNLKKCLINVIHLPVSCHPFPLGKNILTARSFKFLVT